MAPRRSKRKASKKASELMKSTSKRAKPKKKDSKARGLTKTFLDELFERGRRSWYTKEKRPHGQSLREFGQIKVAERRLIFDELIKGYAKLVRGTKVADAAVIYDRDLGPWLYHEEVEEIDEDEGDEEANNTIHGKERWPPNEDGNGRHKPIKMDEAGRVSLTCDPYRLRKHFTTRWGVLKQDVQMGWRLWDGEEWYYENADQTGLRWGQRFGPGGDVSRPWVSLAQLISSQLLLYRIVANFAAPPSTDTGDTYKCAWTYSLWNKDDPSAHLEISEHKGWATAHFHGGEQASNEALQLMEWLLGTNCPHTYDYTLCGRNA